MSSVTRVELRQAVVAAGVALLVFLLVMATSGRVQERAGLGWDGAAYARMVTGSMRDGSPNTAMRPLIILAVRVPYRLGANLITSFQIVHVISAFVLFLVVSLLLQQRLVPFVGQLGVTVNLALCIASAKMFAFYPALIDLGAMAVTTAAVYTARTEHRLATGIACAAAALSREFGIAAALYGIHRSVRLRTPWPVVAATYAPALLVPIVLRIPALGILPQGGTPLTLHDAIENLATWLVPAFPIAFLYFATTLFGGLTLLLVARPQRCFAAVRRELELLTYALPVFAFAAVGESDIWRYLAFVLPVAVMLVGECLCDLDGLLLRRVVLAMLLLTLLTQRPLQAMTTDLYFRDWFPLYRVPNDGTVPADLLRVWWPRLTAAALCVATLVAILRSKPRATQLA